MLDITRPLVDFAYKLSLDGIPSETIERTKMFIADYFAASVAGYQINTAFNTVVLNVVTEEGGAAQSSVLFSDRKFPSSQAAFLNAAFAHGADMDDGNKQSAGHVGTHVMPAVFALAEQKRVNWGDVIVAIVTGYDFFNRIAGAAQPSLYNKGFHSTGIAGSIACAAACAKLLNLDYDGIYNSISMAAVQSSGLIIIDESAQHCKPINPANAARIGVLSALMAEKGLEAPRNPLESTKGWFHAFTDHVNDNVLFDGLGSVFTIDQSYIKQYPSCRHTHGCIDAIKNIRLSLNKFGLTYKDINSILVKIYPNAIRSAGNIKYPHSAGEAKFSIYYAIAKTLLNGNFTLDDLSVTQDENLVVVVEKINLIEDATMEDRCAGIRGCKVKAVLNNGMSIEETVLVPKGEGDNSLNWNDLENKMLSCANGVLSVEESKNVIQQCRHINVNNKFKPIKIQ